MFKVVTADLNNGKNAVIAMQFALKGMKAEQVEAAASTLGLSAAQTAVVLSAVNMEASEIAVKLAMQGYNKEAVISALVTAGFTKEQILAATSSEAFATAEATAAAATNTFTSSLAMATKGLIAFLTTNPVGWAILAAGAIFGLVKAFDFFTLSAEEAAEQMEESVSAFEEATSKVDSLNKELETAIQRIDELESKESLTFVEESELQKLRESVELLQIQADLAEKERVRKAKEAADDTVTAYQKNFKYDISSDAVDEYIANSTSTGNNAILISDESDISAMLAGIEQFKRLRDELDKDSEYYQEDYQHFQEIIDETTGSLENQATVLAGYKANLEAIPYDELSSEQKQALDEINSAIKLIYQSIDPAKWNEIQWNKIANSDQYADAVNELNEIAAETEITTDTIRSKFPQLVTACEDAGLEIDDVVNNLNGMRNVQDETGESTVRYSAKLSNLKDVLSDLKSSYDILEAAQEEMDSGNGLSPDTIADLAEAEENYLDYLYEENGVIKLNTDAWKENANAKMQNEMAEIQKEIDSIKKENVALEELIDKYEEKRLAALEKQDLTTYYDYYHMIDQTNEKIKENNALIVENQGKLSLYSSLYGSITGDLDAYTSALQNFTSIANTIDSVSGSFQTLADLQAQVANGFTMSLDKALEFAKVYPQILNSAQVSADGQITLNEGVVNSFIDGKKAELDAEVDAEIAKLEAEKAVLTAKMEFSEAELELAKSVADGEGGITKELAEYRINAGNAVAQALIDAGIDEATAFKLAAAAMAQNAEEFNRVAMEVCTDVNGNFNKAAYDLAQTMYKNLTNVKTDLASVATQAHETAEAIAGIANGDSNAGSSAIQGGSGGGVGSSGIKLNLTSGSFEGTEYTYTAKESGLEDFISQIELDISNYQDAIAQIDGQIATLQALKNLPLKSFKSGGSGGSGGGSGGSGNNGSDPDSAIEEVEEYTAAIDDYREAIERLNRIQTKRTDLETKLSNTNDLRQQIELQKELVGVYEEEQNALHDVNELRDQTIKDGVESLRQLGFDVEYDPDTNLFFVKNLEHLNELVADSQGEYGSMQEATNALRQDTEKLIGTLGDLNEANQENSESWWELAHAMQEAQIAIYENTVKEHENSITLNENWLDNSIKNSDFGGITRYSSAIIDNYKAMQDEIHKEAEYYRSLGYSDTSDEVSGLMDLWWDYYDKIAETSANAWQQVVDNANNAVDEITGLYDTLKDAAQEYADSGFITIDTLQEICSWGVQYLAYLKDENGQLVINEESIHKVIAARTEQMAVETALAYVAQIRSAVERNEINELANLTMATEITTSATWDLVYAQLKLLNISGDLNDTMYAGALQNINNLRALSGIAISSIGQVEGSVKEANESAKKALQEQADYLDDLLKYVEEMIKQEVENQIDALEKQIDDMKEIVDLQKKSLDLEREKDAYTKTVTEKTKELAKLQQQLALLELDDSRESLAKQAKLREEMADLSNDLADEQADHAYDATSDMLDDMADSYEKEKKKEIEVLEDTISSEEKLYQLAIERIQTQWDTLYQQLIDWNTQYGTVTNNEITAAWDAASAAVQQYGSYLDAILQTQKEIAALEASSSSSSSSTTIGGIGGLTTPNVVGNSGDYDTSGKETFAKANEIVAQMKENSANWHSGDKTALHNDNRDLANQLENLLGWPIEFDEKSGTWYMRGKKLYDQFPIYHGGGIAGDDPTLKQDELFAKVKKGEALFTEEQQEPIYKALDFTETMLSKYGKLFSSMSDTDMIGDRMQEQIKKDSQQTQSIVQNSGMTNEFNISLPVHVLQKLDDAEIQSLTSKISKYTINELDEVFGLRGKRSFRR